MEQLKYQPGDWVTYQNCNYVTSLTEGPEYIYFGTSGGILLFHKYRKQWEIPYTVSDGLNGNWIYAVLYDWDKSQLWASTENGLSVLRSSGSIWETHALTEYNLQPGNPIEMLGQTANYIYCKTGQGITFRIDKNLGFFVAYDEEPDIFWTPNIYLPLPQLKDFFMNKGYLWNKRGEVTDGENRHYQITVYYIDKNRDVYGGTWGAGIFTGDAALQRLTLQQIGPRQNNITSMALADGELWMGGIAGMNGFRTFDQGISVFDMNRVEWKYFESRFIPELQSDDVLIIEKVNAEIWIGTREGIAIYDRKKERWHSLDMFDGLVDNYISSIEFDGSYVWVGTPHGINRVSPDDKEIRQISLSGNGLYSTVYDIDANRDRICFATNNGLFILENPKGEILHIDGFGNLIPPNKLTPSSFTNVAVSDSFVSAIYRDQLLIGRGKEWEIQKLPASANFFFSYDMAQEGKRIWVATNSGLYLYQIDRSMWYHFGIEDGLPSNNVQTVLPDSDSIWIGTDEGLTQFHWSNYVSAN